jgi:hypothetical protein
MKLLSILGGGLAGAVALTILHETLKRVDPDTPRMDLLGMDAATKTLKSVGAKVPDRKELFNWTLAGDIISNTIYYSLAVSGKKKSTWLRGSVLGLAAGIGAVALPKSLGLNDEHSNRTAKTKVMTTALYSIGGLVASATTKYLQNKKEKI